VHIQDDSLAQEDPEPGPSSSSSSGPVTQHRPYTYQRRQCDSLSQTGYSDLQRHDISLESGPSDLRFRSPSPSVYSVGSWASMSHRRGHFVPIFTDNQSLYRPASIFTDSLERGAENLYALEGEYSPELIYKDLEAEATVMTKL
jgi:hypothetical protein